jgi:hypothetical protein
MVGFAGGGHLYSPAATGEGLAFL